MQGFDLLESVYWQPFKYIHLTHRFFNINSETVIYTWITLAILAALIIPIRFILHKKGILRFVLITMIRESAEMSKQTLGEFSFNHYVFVMSLFFFIFIGSIIGVVPFIEEPTGDLNTTLALAIVTFCYIQVYAIKVNGLWAYAKEYFSPIFIMLPLNIISKLATIISLSFRLFGNIFGGAMITKLALTATQGSLWLETFALLSGFNLLLIGFFGVFEALIQAFVFAMLALTYLALALKGEEMGLEPTEGNT